MKRLILLACLAATLHANASELVMTDTQRFIAALSSALERGVIGEAGLERMLAACTKNALANPITELEAATNSQKLADHEVVHGYLSATSLDVKQVCTFVKSSLAALRKETGSREQVQEQTVLPFEAPTQLPVMSFSADSLLCAVDHENNARCFGKYAWSVVIEDAQVPPADLGKVKSIASGDQHACAIRLDDTVICWRAFARALDMNQAPKELGKVRFVAARHSHTCAIKMDNTVACWGYNAHNESTVPKDLGEVIAIAVGGHHSCAIRKDGLARCWGSNAAKQRDVPPDLGTVRSIAAGQDHTCAVTPDGMVRCWGNSEHGLLDPPGDLGLVRAVYAGNSSTCAMTADKITRCWGFYGDKWNNTAELGPLQDVAIGQSYFGGVTMSGHIRCLGDKWGEEFAYDRELRVLGST